MNKLNDKELLELLKKDVKSFNGYRTQFHEQKIDFSGADLGGADLEGVYLRDANFKGANLSEATITLIKENLKSILKAIKGYKNE